MNSVLRILSEADVEAIHAASLTILQRYGVRVGSTAARDILQAGGCRVADDRVYYPSELIEEALNELPRGFKLYGLDTTQVVDYSPGRTARGEPGRTAKAAGGEGEFYSVHGATVDEVGNLYVVNHGNRRFQKFTGSGTLLGWWGKDTDGYTGWHRPGSRSTPTYGSRTEGALYAAQGIAVDTSGNVFVDDWHNNCVLKCRPVAP